MRATNPRQIQAKADQEFRLLADLMGVKLSGDFKIDRAAVDRVLNGGSAGSGMQLGEHPEGRASTLDEIIVRYQDDELTDEYELPKAESEPLVSWFGSEDRESYGVDGFHSGGSSYEFAKLWYHLVGEEFSLMKTPDWAIMHGGLRWEYRPEGETLPFLADHAGTEAAMARAYQRYQETFIAIESGYVPVIPEPQEEVELEEEKPAEADFTTDDLWAILGDEA